jgi:hypothetical protein
MNDCDTILFDVETTYMKHVHLYRNNNCMCCFG